MNTRLRSIPCAVLLAACGGGPAAPPAPAPAPADAPEPAPAPGPAPAELELSALGAEAYGRLRDAQRFTDGGIYDDGVASNELRALRVLWEEPDGARALERLLDAATLPGRLFALCGVYYTDRALFLERVEPYRRSTETVFFQTGCIGLRDQAVSELIESPHEGAVRLEGDETVRDWLARHENPNGTLGGYRMDVIGGGYPNEFRAGGGWHAVAVEPFVLEAD